MFIHEYYSIPLTRNAYVQFAIAACEKIRAFIKKKQSFYQGLDDHADSSV